MKPDRVLFSEEQIHKRVGEIASNVERDFSKRQLAIIGLLEDSFVFMADLIRKIDTEMVCYFMKADVEEDDFNMFLGSKRLGIRRSWIFKERMSC